MPSVTIRVVGIPRPKGSMSAFVPADKSGRPTMYSASGRPKAVVTERRESASRNWQTAVHWAAVGAWQPRPPIARGVPVSVDLVFIMPRPKKAAACAPVTVAPDLDKLVRSVLDGIQGKAGPVLTDDAQVSQITAFKRYAEDGEPPGARITVTASYD